MFGSYHLCCIFHPLPGPVVFIASCGVRTHATRCVIVILKWMMSVIFWNEWNARVRMFVLILVHLYTCCATVQGLLCAWIWSNKCLMSYVKAQSESGQGTRTGAGRRCMGCPSTERRGGGQVIQGGTVPQCAGFGSSACSKRVLLQRFTFIVSNLNEGERSAFYRVLYRSLYLSRFRFYVIAIVL